MYTVNINMYIFASIKDVLRLLFCNKVCCASILSIDRI
jgi:hypothetical protein